MRRKTGKTEDSLFFCLPLLTQRQATLTPAVAQLPFAFLLLPNATTTNPLLYGPAAFGGTPRQPGKGRIYSTAATGRPGPYKMRREK